MDPIAEAINDLIVSGVRRTEVVDFIDALPLEEDHRDALWFLVGYQTEVTVGSKETRSGYR